jgi:hypothetical protein
MAFWFEASYADFPLSITRITTDDGRDISVQSPSRGSKHTLQDRGAKFGRVDAELVFVDEPGRPDFRDRFDAWRKIVHDTRGPQIFSHPMLGSYLARVEGGQHVGEAARMITWSCSFLPESDPQTVSAVLAGVSTFASVQAVEVASQVATEQLAELGLSSVAIDESIEAVTTWNATDDLDSQAVLVGVASMTSALNDAIDELELTSHLDRWQAYAALINLAYAMRRAADALTSTSGHTTPLHVIAAEPLLSICASVYGPDNAEEMSAKVARSNRVRTPGLVPAGTTLNMPPMN